MSDQLHAMSDLDLSGKRVLIRVDLNVPIRDGVITSRERIERVLPTIRQAIQAGAKVVLMSHWGRPTEGQFDANFSLRPVCDMLASLLDESVLLVQDPWAKPLPDEKIILLENTRFWSGESDNDPVLSRRLAELADIFVMDAFATAHRAQASTVGVALASRQRCAGPLLCEELAALRSVLTTPKKPVAAIIGGAKVSTKIKLIDAMLPKVDTLILGGGIANTFLLASGVEIGQSLAEPDCVSYAKKALEKAALLGVNIPLPTDVITAKSMEPSEPTHVRVLTDCRADECIFDVGPETQASYAALMADMGTIIWNGPVGLFERLEFSAGTRAIAQAVADSSAYSLAGGGDTLAALETFGFRDKMSYISTGGGAFLAWCEGQSLPAIEALKQTI